MYRSFPLFIGLMTFAGEHSLSAYELSDHPRILLNKAQLTELAQRSQGTLAGEYARIKAEADRAMSKGLRSPKSRFHAPTDQICLGITYMIERQRKHDALPYAAAITEFWADGQALSLEGTGHFGYYAMIYDWIHDAMTPDERKRFGNALGPWLRWYTDAPEITLANGHWRYNQTWGPSHLNTPNTRDGITPKLLVAIAIAGAGTDYDTDAIRFLDSWSKRIPSECIPAFDEMGGVWSESMGHGNYGPVVVIPWAFEAWRTATGDDLFQRCASNSFLPEMTSWALHLTVPFSNRTAWIDDNRATELRVFSRVAPILAGRYRDALANGVSNESFEKGWNKIPWNRFLSFDPTVGASTPDAESSARAKHFKGAGHVYMRSDWGTPDATWAFFGAGPALAAHSRDDEGHFLIAKNGWLVLRAGGSGHNDRDYFAGGSLAFNVVTVYDPDEKFRRTDPGPRALAQGGVKNENDGGLIRHIYSRHDRKDRGSIVSDYHDDRLTYAAADLTPGYRASKVREVTRQFVYLRGPREFFITFDRVESTDKDFPKTWLLHIPSEPSINGAETVRVRHHVASYRGDIATWLSSSAGDPSILSHGRSRAFLKTLLPQDPTIVKRGGDGHQFWGHPHEPTAQYNHVGSNSLRPPIVPWRLEVEGPSGGERDFFLHVLEIAEESDTKMSKVELIKNDGQFGVRIDGERAPVEIVFAAEGPLSALARFGEKELHLK